MSLLTRHAPGDHLVPGRRERGSNPVSRGHRSSEGGEACRDCQDLGEQDGRRVPRGHGPVPHDFPSAKPCLLVSLPPTGLPIGQPSPRLGREHGAEGHVPGDTEAKRQRSGRLETGTARRVDRATNEADPTALCQAYLGDRCRVPCRRSGLAAAPYQSTRASAARNLVPYCLLDRIALRMAPRSGCPGL
jgi:hypothetical protein